MSQVRAAWSAADPFAVHVEQELIVGADIDDEVRWLRGKSDCFAEVEDRQIALRATRRSYPLSFPDGGLGFLLGDGKLNYSRENILEGFYTLHAWRGIFPALGLEYMVNPGYNADRGPVIVPTLRLHVEF